MCFSPQLTSVTKCCRDLSTKLDIMPCNNFRGQGYGKGYDGKGYDGRRPYRQPYQPGPHGKGSSKGLSDLLGQLRSEIAAQHQLQAIAGVLMPGSSAGSLAAPLQQAHDLTVQNTNELKAIKDMLAAVQSDKNSASAAVPDEDVANPKISAMLNQIRADLVQSCAAQACGWQPSVGTSSSPTDLEAELAAPRLEGHGQLRLQYALRPLHLAV